MVQGTWSMGKVIIYLDYQKITLPSTDVYMDVCIYISTVT